MEEKLSLQINEQEATDNLWNIIYYMHANWNESGEIFYKNANAEPVQINTTARKRLQI